MTTSLENLTPEQITSLAALAASMRDNPQTRQEFLHLTKKANPNLSIPEIDLELKAREQFATRDKELADLKAQMEADRQQAAAQARVAALREEGVIRTANEFNDVVKYAAENGFQTTDAGLKRAAEARRREQEAAIPTPTSAIPKPHIGNKDLMRNPQQWARDQASAAIDEIKSARPRGY